MLVSLLRRPKASLIVAVGLFILSLAAVSSSLVRFEFFASDPFRFFYANVQMPPGTSLQKSMSTALKIEHTIKQNMRPDEIRATASFAGLSFTSEGLIYGDENAQVLVSLKPKADEMREVDNIIESLREAVSSIPGPAKISFQKRESGPPTTRPVSIKVRGNKPDEIRQVADIITNILSKIPAISDIVDDDSKGRMELAIRLNPDAVTRAGVDA